MLTWIMENLATIIICAVLLLAVGAIVRNLVLRRRSGKASCGCGCEHCAMSRECHKKS